MPDIARLLAALDRVNVAHPWSHNDVYAGFVMKHARAVRCRGGTAVLDVGCGTGNLLERLTQVLPSVVGIEPDPDVAAAASTRFRSSPVDIQCRPFGDEPHQAYDLITFVASIHHMPLLDTLQQARAALRRGGRLVIVGVAKETPDDRMRGVLSTLLNSVIGVLRHPHLAVGMPAHMQAPTAPAADTFDEIQAAARTVLPGIRMRRRLFWRYTASWIAA